jgi:hypothetical protein
MGYEVHTLFNAVRFEGKGTHLATAPCVALTPALLNHKDVANAENQERFSAYLLHPCSRAYSTKLNL